MISYVRDEIRRQDRILDPARAFQLLQESEYGILSLCGENGPYGVPFSYVWDGEDSLYFHCAPEGKKLSLIVTDCPVSFCIVGKTKVLSAQFSTGYESIILSGTIRIPEEDAERRRGLELLIGKYSPGFEETGMNYIEKSFHKTVVLKMTVKAMSGKSRSSR